MTRVFSARPVIPVSWGELIDKITILEMKSGVMTGRALENVRKELALLEEIAGPGFGAGSEIGGLKAELRSINETLWRAEDCLRDKERAGIFDGEFVELARSVYLNNDRRAQIKRRISRQLGSEIVEEKRYGTSCTDKSGS